MHISNISEVLLSPPVPFDTLNYLSLSQTESSIELMNELLSQCPNIRYFSLNHPSLNTLPNLGLCPNLNSVTINAPIEKLGFNFSNLPKLTHLQTAGWRIKDYSFLKDLNPALVSLYINNPVNGWSNLPDISGWKQLSMLRLENCADEKLSYNPLISKHLSSVSLLNSSFINVVETLTACENLRTLEMSKLPEVSFKECREKLPQLHYLTIHAMPLKEANEPVEKIGNWYNLNLFENNVVFENIDFCDKLPNLKNLNLHGNYLVSPILLLKEKAVQMQSLNGVLKDMKYKNHKEFCALASAIAKSKLSREDQEFFITFLATKTKLDINKKWDWTTTLKATNISHVNFRKKIQALIDEKVATKVPTNNWSNAVIYITGKPKMKVTELKNQMEELGLKYAANYSEAVTHVLIGMGSPDYDLLADKVFIPITESNIQQLYGDTQPQFLKETAAEEGGQEMMENLGKLLTSSDVANVKIGIEMIKAGGTPPGIFEELLVVQKTTSDGKIRKVVQDLLEIEAPLEWKEFVRDRLSFKMVHSNKSESEIRRQLQAIAKRISPTMAAKFSMMLFRHTGRGLRYALTARLAAGLKEEAYGYLLKDNHFDFSKGLSMRPLAERDLDYYSLPSSSVMLPILAVKMATIHSLNLHNCGYHAVEPQISAFKDLKHLDFSDNDLSSLPLYFAELTNLETVNLRNHLFREFPAVLIKMPRLKKIDLRISRTDYRYGQMSIPPEFKAQNPDCEVFV